MNLAEIDRKPPLLEPGQRLDRFAFHERYAAMPPPTRAELIDGVVYMPSPLHLDHGRENALIVGWILAYERATRGLSSEVGVSTALDDGTETQPDANLRIRPEFGGRTRESRILEGPPELVVEISRSTRAFDLGPKRLTYERAGILEYLVVALDPDEIHWFRRREGRFERLAPDADGLYRSRTFPGLWLDSSALFSDDLDALLRAVEAGTASPEHLAFVERLTGSK